MKFLISVLLLLFVLPTFAQTNTTSYTSSDEHFQFEYPADWFVIREESGSVLLSNGKDPSLENQVAILVLFKDYAPQFMEATQAVTFLLGQTASLDKMTEEQFGDKHGMYTEVEDEEGIGLSAVIELDGAVGGVIAAVLDETTTLEALRLIALDILNSISYNKPPIIPLEDLEEITPDTSALTSTLEFGRGRFSLNYAEDWNVQQSNNNTVSLAMGTFNPETATDPQGLINIQVFPIPSNIREIESFLISNIREFFNSSLGTTFKDQSLIEFNLDGRRAVRVATEDYAGVIMVILLDDETFATIISTAPTDNALPMQATTFAVASTLQSHDLILSADTSSLTETFSAEDGTYSIDYPEGWTVNLLEKVAQLSNMEIGTELQLQADQLFLSVSVFPKSDISGLSDDSSLLDVVAYLQTTLELVTLPIGAKLNGSDVVLMDLEIGNVEGLAVIRQLEDGQVAQVIAIANPGEFEGHVDLVYAIASSIEVGSE